MKIIEAMKQIKDLLRKAADLREKIQNYAADMSINTPTYENQRAKVDGWLQAHDDVLKEIEHLRVSITRTNVLTLVAIDIGGKKVTKPIAGWIQRRKDLAGLAKTAWSGLNQLEKTGKVREATINNPATDEPNTEIKIRRYYDPELRDKRVEMYSAEPAAIDGRLEVVNAVTDLVEK
jgi:hypothetical protein